MKGKFSILAVAIAAFLLVAFSAVPHHHHGAMMCLATEHREEAHNQDADHACTHHDTGEENHDAGGSCAAEVEYLVAAQQEINGKHFSCTLHHPPFPLLPALSVWVNLSDDITTAPGRKHKYRPAVLLIESADAGQIHGLRAPPVS